MTQEQDTRCGYVAIIGEPNTGKSTLLNAFMGAKLSIVTHKVQTTRRRIRGIAIEGPTQMVFVDTPGIFKPERALDKAMVTQSWLGVAEADIAVLLVEAQKKPGPGLEALLEKLHQKPPKGGCFLVINKIDRSNKETLPQLIQTLNTLYPFDQTYLISASLGYGLDKLRQDIAAALPYGIWLYPEDQMADLPLRDLAAEITREKLMLRLHEELPYHLTVETESWTELKNGSVRIVQIIYLTQKGHKPILLGKGGQTIKSISIEARQEISKLLGQDVHLFLEVKIDPNWLSDSERYNAMGLKYKPNKPNKPKKGH